MPRVFFSLGSNVGDRRACLSRAREALSGLLEDLTASSIYETDPQDVTDQPRFLNMVVAGSTSLGPERLLDGVHQIEESLGRDRGSERPKGPRTLDIDILLYGDAVRTGAPPFVPHPRMNRRLFVLTPLLEIAPDLRDPRSGEPYEAIRRRLPPQGIYPA